MYVVFNGTATTDIYTYLHTLTLHYALPIWGCRRAAGGDLRARSAGQHGRHADIFSRALDGSTGRRCGAERPDPGGGGPGGLRLLDAGAGGELPAGRYRGLSRSLRGSDGRPREGAGADTGTAAARSEEHTSELQSLMRISYAV